MRAGRRARRARLKPPQIQALTAGNLTRSRGQNWTLIGVNFACRLTSTGGGVTPPLSPPGIERVGADVSGGASGPGAPVSGGATSLEELPLPPSVPASCAK